MFYQSPFQPAPSFPDGEPITAGPFNAQQAPSLQCENCGQPITVGQLYCTMYRNRLGCGTQTGRLAALNHEESNPLDANGQPIPIYFHEDCSAEYAHDHITKEPCGEEADVERLCSNCEARMEEDE